MSVLFCVLPFMDGWAVQRADVQQGPYLSRDLALQVAVSQAMRLLSRGVRARIAVQDEHGRLVERWPDVTARDEDDKAVIVFADTPPRSLFCT